MIDQFRRNIQQQLDQLLADADKLRRALAALDGANGSAPTQPTARPNRTAAKGRRRVRTASRNSGASTEAGSRSAAPEAVPAAPSPVSVTTRTRERAAGTRPPRRAAQGQTKSAVLAALSSGQAMTAGDVAAATGLGRATVSTTLSKLAKTGEVAKADRGYQRPESARAS